MLLSSTAYCLLFTLQDLAFLNSVHAPAATHPSPFARFGFPCLWSEPDYYL
jgi:hypothetical protein